MAKNNDVIGYLIENSDRCEKDFRESNLFVDIHNKPKAPRRILHLLVESSVVSREKKKGVWYYNLIEKDLNEELPEIIDDEEIGELFEEIKVEQEIIEKIPSIEDRPPTSDEINFPALSIQKEKKKPWWKRK